MDRINFIDEQILDEIKRKKERLEKCGNCLIRNAIQRCFEHCIQKEATLHSFRIEHDAQFFRTDYNTHASARNIKKGVKSINDAMTWGLKNFDPKNFNDEFILNLAARVTPELFTFGRGFYRTGNVRISGADWTPPYAEKVLREMNKFTQDTRRYIDENNFLATLETAIFAHLHLVRIHPFDDGNGRTSRTLQNVMLKSVGLPPPIIYAGERHDYYGHLQEAINDWRYRTSDPEKETKVRNGERSFYNYMAGKVSASLDRVIGK